MAEAAKMMEATKTERYTKIGRLAFFSLFFC